MKDSILDGFRRWKDYSGRSTRKQFWWFQLVVLLWPLISGVLTLLTVFIGRSEVPLGVIVSISPLSFLLIGPPFIAVSVRRMHDVGKSGWFNLVPIYSSYLHLQPAKELGRIQGWIFAERTALVFAGLTVIPVFTDGVSALTGVFFWSAIYIGIRVRNAKKNGSASS